jgi:hypothetical protein
MASKEFGGLRRIWVKGFALAHYSHEAFSDRNAFVRTGLR